MATPLPDILDTLRLQIEARRKEYARLKERNRLLEEENADLRRLAAEAQKEREKAMLDAEFLAVSHKLADSPDTLVSARRHLARLNRNIDRCLEMLKE